MRQPAGNHCIDKKWKIKLKHTDNTELDLAWFCFALSTSFYLNELQLHSRGQLKHKKACSQFLLVLKSMIAERKNGWPVLQKSNQTRGITPKHVTSGGVNLRSVAPGQHSSEETWQEGELLATLCPIWSALEPKTNHADKDAFDH